MNLLNRRHATAASVLFAMAGSALSGHAQAQSTEPFPAVFELSSMLPGNGGDGTNGFVLNGIDPGDLSGHSVSSAGDVNGDGIDDLIIGAVRADPNGINQAGESYVVFGRAGVGIDGAIELSSLNGTNGFVLNGIDPYDRSGSSVSSAGDMNGDGFDDLIIGAPVADPNGNSLAGQSYVVFGSVGVGFGGAIELSSLNGTNGFVLSGIDASDRSGSSVASAGDMNNDGYDDVIIGAPRGFQLGNPGAGESYVVFGAPGVGTGGFIDLSTLDGHNGFVVKGIDAKDQSGIQVSSAGDVNGDGYDDVIIGQSEGESNEFRDSGTSSVVFGGENVGSSGVVELSSLNGVNGFVLNGLINYDYSGRAVSSAGDVNGDGFDDLLIGAHVASPNNRIYSGQSYITFGAPDIGAGGSIELASLDGSNGFMINGAGRYDFSGFAVSSAGDVNGDGFDDVLIGGQFTNGLFNPYDRTSETSVVFGNSQVGSDGVLELSSLDGMNSMTLFATTDDDCSGCSVSAAGDVNGDGIDDFLIGARSASPNGLERAGGAYVVFGRDLAPCLADINGDGALNSRDIRAFIKLYRTGDPAADQNADGSLTGHDISQYISMYQDGCD